MESTVKQRLIEFLKYKKLSQAKFEKRINAGNGFVNNIQRSIGAEKLQSIITEFPDINTEWLLYGRGNMIKTEVEQEVGAVNDDVAVSREAWEMIKLQIQTINNQQQTIQSQQQTIDYLTKKGVTADNAKTANAG